MGTLGDQESTALPGAEDCGAVGAEGTVEEV